jgi:hypothetical protein
MNTESQNKQITDYLLSGKSLTSIDALHKFNCLRLSARIANIREKYNVQTEIVTLKKSGKRIAKYSIPV